MAFNIRVPYTVFKSRVQIEESPGYQWQDTTTLDLFSGKRVGFFALPGAFTPVCSSTHLPGYELHYPDLINAGLDDVYCLSVNDAFTMNAWMKQTETVKVKPIPDGTGEFTRKMGMLVRKDNVGFGMRSWRYSMVVNDGTVEMMWVEPGLMDDHPGDPFMVSDAKTMLGWLQSRI